MPTPALLAVPTAAHLPLPLRRKMPRMRSTLSRRKPHASLRPAWREPLRGILMAHHGRPRGLGIRTGGGVVGHWRWESRLAEGRPAAARHHHATLLRELAGSWPETGATRRLLGWSASVTTRKLARRHAGAHAVGRTAVLLAGELRHHAHLRHAAIRRHLRTWEARGVLDAAAAIWPGAAKLRHPVGAGVMLHLGRTWSIEGVWAANTIGRALHHVLMAWVRWLVVKSGILLRERRLVLHRSGGVMRLRAGHHAHHSRSSRSGRVHGTHATAAPVHVRWVAMLDPGEGG